VRARESRRVLVGFVLLAVLATIIDIFGEKLGEETKIICYGG
jgi:hypothetical protein